MAKLSDLYDPQVIESITKTVDEEAIDEARNLLSDIKDPEFKLTDGHVLFSDLFHKPQIIPDIPVRVFNDSDWAEAARMYIPDVDENWVWNKKVLEQLALAMYCFDTILLWGLQGTGKSCAIEQWCASTRIPFWRMNCNRETREQHFLGAPSVEYDDEGKMYIRQEPTVLTESLRYGGVFCEDEAFRHNSALVLQSLREKSNRSVVLPDAPGREATDRKLHAPEGKWWYVLTDNTTGSGDETGIFDAEVQDASTTDRIDAAIEVPYLGKPEERRLLQQHTELNETIINGMLDMAKQIRQNFRKGHMMNTMSVRGLLAWGEKIEMTKSIGFALQLSFCNKLGTDDAKIVEDLFFKIFGAKINE
jgi:MoxR-like ATPase